MKEVINAIRNIANKNDQVYSILAKVTDVDSKNRVCDVKPLNGDADIFGVRLQPNTGKKTGLVCFPEVGSVVIVTFISSEAGYIASHSDLEKVEFVKKTLKITVDTEGVHYENKGADLRKVIDALVANSEKTYDFLIKLKVITPSGTGVLSPEMIVQVTAEKLKLETLKQQIGQLLT